MRLVYFASVREAIGVDGEDWDLPLDVQTIADSLNWLRGQGENYQVAFANPDRLRFAVDQVMVKADAALVGAKELAIFPPVTGG
jgi:sulfur-carrier protein